MIDNQLTKQLGRFYHMLRFESNLGMIPRGTKILRNSKTDKKRIEHAYFWPITIMYWT